MSITVVCYLIYYYFDNMFVLWPYEWKVTSLNLDRQELTFIFANFSLEWMWKGRGNPSRRGNQ